MAQRKGTSTRFQAPGIFQWLIDHQKRARDSIDLRLVGLESERSGADGG